MELHFIRGERLLQQLEELSTYAQLQQNTQRGFPQTPRQQNAGTVQIANMKLQPFGPTNDLKAVAEARNEGKTYNPSIMFLQVEFEDEDTQQNVTFTGSDGEEYHIQPINLNGSNVKVACTCLDFYWRFATFNANDNSLDGQPPPPYQKRSETRGPANPQRVPGVCKHIMKTVENLRQTGLVR